MNKTIKYIGLLAMAVVFTGFLKSCKNNDPSVAKVFVRSASNELVVGAKVVLIGDVNSNPATVPYVDTVVTNNSGFAVFYLDDHYEEGVNEYGKDYTVAYFDIIAKKGSLTATGDIRTRVHTTAVETVYFN